MDKCNISLLFHSIRYLASKELSSDDNEAHSLITNVAGRVLMLQKDKPAADRGAKEVNIKNYLQYYKESLFTRHL